MGAEFFIGLMAGFIIGSLVFALATLPKGCTTEKRR